MKASNYRRLAMLSASVPLVVIASLPSAEAAPSSADMATSMRLSPSQYELTIADIFGESIRVGGRFEPELRDQGMLAIGERTSNISDSGLEAYDEIARDVAAQVVDERHRAELVGCKPAADTGRDDKCARSFFARVGPLLYRRPLSEDEIEARVAVGGNGSRSAPRLLHRHPPESGGDVGLAGVSVPLPADGVGSLASRPRAHEAL